MFENRKLNRAWWACCANLFVCCFLLATWIVRIPDVADTLDLNEGGVGTAILGFALGAFIAFLVAGRALGTRDSRTIGLIFGLINALGLVLIALPWNLLSLFLLLMVFGFGHGGLNVAMNTQALEVDVAFGRLWMLVFQACYSLGGLTGALCGSLIIALDISYQAQFVATALCAPFALALIYLWAIPDMPDGKSAGSSQPLLVFPSRTILGLALLSLCASFGEGAVGDWGALYLERDLKVEDAAGVFGYASFSLCMLIGRLSAKLILRHLAPQVLALTAGVLVSVGLAAGLVINEPISVIIGFGMVGLGLSVVNPLAYSAVADHPEVSRGRAIAGVTTLGYTGFVFGPPMLGWFAEATSLRLSLFIVAAVAAVIVFLAPHVATKKRL